MSELVMRRRYFKLQTLPKKERNSQIEKKNSTSDGLVFVLLYTHIYIEHSDSLYGGSFLQQWNLHKSLQILTREKNDLSLGKWNLFVQFLDPTVNFLSLWFKSSSPPSLLALCTRFFIFLTFFSVKILGKYPFVKVPTK